MLWWTLKKLKSRNEVARADAIRTLLRIGGALSASKFSEIFATCTDRKAIDVIIEVLRTADDRSTKCAAARALGLIRETAAVMPLCETVITDHPELGVIAAHALASIRDTRATIPLTAALRESYCGLDSAAATALGRIGDPRAIGPLAVTLKASDSRPELREAAARALVQIPDSNAIASLVSALCEAMPEVRQITATVLETICLPDVGKMTCLLKDERADVRRLAARVLMRVADKRATAALVEALQDEDWDVRALAVKALECMCWAPANAVERDVHVEAHRYLVSGTISISDLLDVASQPMPSISHTISKRSLTSPTYYAGYGNQLATPDPVVLVARALIRIEKLLAAHPRRIKWNDLQRAARLQDFDFDIETPVGDPMGWSTQTDYERFDCTSIRKIATEEMNRRAILGLEAVEWLPRSN